LEDTARNPAGIAALEALFAVATVLPARVADIPFFVRCHTCARYVGGTAKRVAGAVESSIAHFVVGAIAIVPAVSFWHQPHTASPFTRHIVPSADECGIGACITVLVGIAATFGKGWDVWFDGICRKREVDWRDVYGKLLCLNVDNRDVNHRGVREVWQICYSYVDK